MHSQGLCFLAATADGTGQCWEELRAPLPLHLLPKAPSQGRSAEGRRQLPAWVCSGPLGGAGDKATLDSCGQRAWGLDEAAFEAPSVAGLWLGLMASEPFLGSCSSSLGQQGRWCGRRNPGLISVILRECPPSPGLGFSLSLRVWLSCLPFQGDGQSEGYYGW